MMFEFEFVLREQGTDFRLASTLTLKAVMSAPSLIFTITEPSFITLVEFYKVQKIQAIAMELENQREMLNFFEFSIFVFNSTRLEKTGFTFVLIMTNKS